MSKVRPCRNASTRPSTTIATAMAMVRIRGSSAATHTRAAMTAERTAVIESSLTVAPAIPHRSELAHREAAAPQNRGHGVHRTLAVNFDDQHAYVLEPAWRGRIEHLCLAAFDVYLEDVDVGN